MKVCFVRIFPFWGIMFLGLWRVQINGFIIADEEKFEENFESTSTVDPDAEIGSIDRDEDFTLPSDSTESFTEDDVDPVEESSSNFTPSGSRSDFSRLDFPPTPEMPNSSVNLETIDSIDHFNPESHIQFKEWLLLAFNRLRLDFNNHIHTNRDVFSQIIAKFEQINEAITGINKYIGVEKAKTNRRFTATKTLINKNDLLNKQRQYQISESIKRNKERLRTNKSQAKQDKASDKQASQGMMAGLKTQVAGAQDSMKQNMEQMMEKMKRLDHLISNI